MDVIYRMFVETICVGVAVVFLFLFCNILWKRKKSVGRSVPQPAGSWPLIGHLPLLSDPAVPHQVFGAMADQYGPIFMVKLGFHNAIVVSSSEIAKECFTTNDKAFVTRPRSIAVKTMGYNYALFGFGPYDSYWREARKIAVLELLSNHRLELLKDVRKSEVEMSIAELYRVCQPKSDNLYKPVLVEMKQWFGAFTLNVIVRMVAGKRYSNAVATKLDGHGEGERLRRVVKDYVNLVGLFVVADTIPWLEWLDFKGHLKAMKRTAKEIDSILSLWLEEHRRSKLVDGSKTEQDFMYVLSSKKLSHYD